MSTLWMPKYLQEGKHEALLASQGRSIWATKNCKSTSPSEGTMLEALKCYLYVHYSFNSPSPKLLHAVVCRQAFTRAVAC